MNQRYDIYQICGQPGREQHLVVEKMGQSPGERNYGLSFGKKCEERSCRVRQYSLN
jgi:hypothetical protein